MSSDEFTEELDLITRCDLREIGSECVWSLSSSKQGNGIHQILDDKIDTYWQSDGVQPHYLNLQFHSRVSVSYICFYLDYKNDESYTPKKISIRIGSTYHDLVEVTSINLDEPRGWITIPLKQSVKDDAGNDTEDNNTEHHSKSVKTWFVQASIIAMHQNGKDTHIRQVKIFGPRSTFEGLTKFSAVELSALSSLR